MTYDSTLDTVNHIHRVRELLDDVQRNLRRRAAMHDASKLQEPEKSTFDRVTPMLKTLTYGSAEYAAQLADMGDALAHHYAHNSHHPQHYENGLDGMSLFDLIEMLCDWKAAGERHENGSMAQSLEINRTRFRMSTQLHNILVNTACELYWI